MIYADNAATTKLDIEAFDEMKPFLLEEFGNASQPYFFSKTTKLALRQARERIARCINAEPDEIYFTSGGTESDNWALKGIGLPGEVKRIITSQVEHHAILNACKHMEAIGVNVEYLPTDESGVVLPEYLDEIIGNNNLISKSNVTTLASVMLANNEIGSIEPVRELARIAHSNGAYFHTDAVQAVGHIKIDVKELDVDLLSASAHKFNGPKGIGFLYVKKGVTIQSLNDGGAQEHGKRAGTENVASIVGMAKALENNVTNMQNNTKKIIMLENLLERLLKEKSIDYVRNGATNHIPGNMSLSFPGQEGEAILHRLDLMKICVSTGSACDSVNTQISHVLRAIGLKEEIAEGTIRISLGKDNTEQEVHEIAEAIYKIMK